MSGVPAASRSDRLLSSWRTFDHLRTVLGAAQLKDLISGKQSLESMLEDDKVLLAKLALIARQYDYLLSHTL